MGKTGGKSGHFAKGKDPRRGGGLPGRSGRKPHAFIAECDRIADEILLPKVRDYLQLKGNNPSDAGFRWAGDLVVSYAKGKPMQPIDLGLHHEEALDDLE